MRDGAACSAAGVKPNQPSSIYEYAPQGQLFGELKILVAGAEHRRQRAERFAELFQRRLHQRLAATQLGEEPE